ncbi:MAG TPA: efflux RND transporter periplasmic adaptor subunit [Cyanobacteria bacterium UBA8553]|nr:efflux RND transporter periplasmic adaptor subunit [Cyanobacteria bacterium UBA8553]
MKPSESQVSVKDSDRVLALDNQSPTVSPPQGTQKSWLWVLLILLFAGGGFAVWQIYSPSNKPAQPAKTKAQPPRPVETVTLTQGSGMRSIKLLGQVEASERATIRSQTEGVVKQILVQPGDRVTARMTVAILDDANQRLAVSQAQARLAQERSNLARLEVGTRREIIAQRQAGVRSAQAREKEAQDNLKRTSDLVAQGALSQRLLVEATAAADAAQGARLQAEATLAEATAGPTREEIDAQRANVAAAQAALNQARLSLERTRIVALSDGVVQSRQVSPGDYVESANPVLTLVAGGKLDIFLELPEELSGSVRPGMTVTLTAPRALPQWRERTTITAAVPNAEAASRRQRVRVRLDNPPTGLLSGMAIQGELELRANSPSFVVSRDALTQRGNQWLIFTVANGKAQQHEVELLADMGQNVAIYSKQLRVGQPVVVTGGDGLKNGAAVKVVNG